MKALVGLVVISLLLIGLFLVKNSKSPSSIVSSSQVTQQSQSNSSSHREELSEFNEVTSTESASIANQCSEWLALVRNLNTAQLKSAVPMINQVIAEHDKDVVLKALAVEFSPLVAYRLKSSIGFTVEDEERRFKQFIDFAEYKNAKLTIGTSTIREYFDGREHEFFQKQLINKPFLTMEIIELIKTSPNENSLIRFGMEHVQELNAGAKDFGNYQASSILEAILIYGNDENFNDFLAIGGHIPNDEFGVNPLELLVFGNQDLDFRGQENTLAYLLGLGLQVRLNETVQGSDEIGQYFPYYMLNITEFTIDDLELKGIEVIRPVSLESLNDDMDLFIVRRKLLHQLLKSIGSEVDSEVLATFDCIQ